LGGGEAGANAPGIGDVARRITSRTTDLIAIGIVLVATLTLGRQVLEWWHVAPPEPGALPTTARRTSPWEDERQPIGLEFGDSPLSMTRQVVSGDRQTAIDALVAQCRQTTVAANHPWRERDEAEARLLAKTAELEPIAEVPGVWQVFAIEAHFPMVAGVRALPSDAGAGSIGHVADAASVGPRLICWGMAMPFGENTWNAYTFQGSTAANTSRTGLPTIPLPPGAHRSLSLRDERGGAIIGFYGSGEPGDWMKFYDKWFANEKWSADERGRVGARAWSAQFRKTDAADDGRVEIQFAVDGNRQLTGLIQISP